MTTTRLLGVVPTWHDHANCKGTDTDSFYPERGYSADYAKSVCHRCPVQRECLEWALEHDEQFGVWGGLSEKERREIKRRDRQEVAA